MANRVGINITPEAINDFFTLKKNPSKNEVKPKTANYTMHNPSGRQQQANAGKTAQERRTSGSKEVYNIWSDATDDYGY